MNWKKEQRMDIVQAAKILAGRRRRVVSRCQHCGRRISGTTRRRYCSAACRQAVYYRRKRRV